LIHQQNAVINRVPGSGDHAHHGIITDKRWLNAGDFSDPHRVSPSCYIITIMQKNNESTQTAVVIGGGGGVGRGVSLGLADAGYKIAVADLDLQAAQTTCQEIITNGGEAKPYQVDATNEDSLKSFAESVAKADVLVSTVGVILEKKLEDVTPAEWNWLWTLNVVAQTQTVNAFLPYLRKSSKAHIVLTGSGAGLCATSVTVRIGAYSTTKHALTGYAKNLRAELSTEGIGVTLLLPSGVAGNLAETSAKSHQKHIPQTNEEFGGKQPTGRTLIDNLEMGPIVLNAIRNNVFLASNKMAAIQEAVRDEISAYLA
jgi:NAD(P)-dependent dehydrogenase (short-subunit alcohol dehydrogenase family)